MTEITIRINVDNNGERTVTTTTAPSDDAEAVALLSPTFNPPPSLSRWADAFNLLSPRERGILTYLCAGLRNQRIADHMGISERTVRTHVHNIMTLIGVHSSRQAITLALLAGVIPAEQVFDILRKNHDIQDAEED